MFRRDDLDSSLKKFLRNFIVPIRYKLIKTIPPVKLTKRCMKNLGDHYNNHPVYINRKVASNCTSGNAFDWSGRETGKRRSITGTTSNKVLSVSRRADRVTMRFRLAINVLKPRLPAMWRILVINHARSWHVRRVNRVINIPSLV